MQANDDSIAG